MWTVSIALFVTFLSLWLIWRKRLFSFFKSHNIPGPPPSIFFGNFWEILTKGQIQCEKDWIEKYGRILGYYYGTRPVLLIADPDLLKNIQQKDFHKFANRPKIFEVTDASIEYNEHSLVHLRDKKWKDVRSIITPTFTVSKLKMMFPIIGKAVQELDEAIEKKAKDGESFNIYNLYQNLTLDVISRSSLGLHTNAQTNPKEPFARMARAFFSLNMSPLFLFTFCFPELSLIFATWRKAILAFRNEGKYPRKELRDSTHTVIVARKNDPKLRRNDLLQLMIDAKNTKTNTSDKQLTAGEHDDSPFDDASQNNDMKDGLKMTDEEVAQNAALFLLAGYETTSTALGFITHLLAHHPDVQDRLRSELNQYLQDSDGKLTYEIVQKLQYFDQVINESLRIHPPIVFFNTRTASEDVVYDKLMIPKGLTVQVPVYYLHHDSTYWNDPEKFDPDRFSPEGKKNNHPMAFQPFGAGPRNCVGMRFAVMEAKMALAKILKTYKICPAPGSNKDLHTSLTLVSRRPVKGVFVQLQKLQN